jgi:pyruvate dehydrogenase E1 component alpha subunit
LSVSRLAAIERNARAAIERSAPAPSRADLLRGYRTMLLIREMEQQLVAYNLEHKVFSFVHFSIGQEAVAAGVCNALRPQGSHGRNHRSHGRTISPGWRSLPHGRGDARSPLGMLRRKGGSCT